MVIMEALVVTKAPVVNNNSPVKNDRVFAKILTALAIALRVKFMMMAKVMMMVAGTFIAKVTGSMVRCSAFVTMVDWKFVMMMTKAMMMVAGTFIAKVAESMMIRSAFMTMLPKAVMVDIT
ncbi:hypothetical protein [Mesobacillus foraminis]|uniref:hypothetical protein n=1 Tax=Mesobacillus foraminis TaxID=279826 RepID=UPI000EF4E75E|nr:hypothetical protein [Mesobacillus foraminis]